MDWTPIVTAGVGGIVGSGTTFALKTRAKAHDDLRKELHELRAVADTAKEQALLNNITLVSLNQRIDDLLHRLDG